jgi:hypothetical protein
MIKLDAWDTAKLLMTKGWTVKGIPKEKDESTLLYSNKVFAEMCGCDISDVDT